jgi:hypothetical protein
MRIAQENITVISDPRVKEVSVLLAGMRITFDNDEARLLSRELTAAIARLDGADRLADLPASTAKTSVPPSSLTEEKDRIASGLRSILNKAS